MQLIVMGMHRSGTSMVNRILNLMGIYFGPEGIETDTALGLENIKGFWERRDIRRLNEDLLADLGCDWKHVISWDPVKVSDSSRVRFANNAQLTLLRLDAHRPWTFKDPRTCLTFSFWRPLLEFPVIVWALRHPMKVAHSLKARNGFPLEFGLALWEVYLGHALAATQGLPRVVFDFDRLISDPVGQVERAFLKLNDLGLRSLREVNAEEIMRFVDSDLDHFPQVRDHDSETLTPTQAELWRRLQAQSAFEDPPGIHESAIDMLHKHRDLSHPKDHTNRKVVQVEKTSRSETDSVIVGLENKLQRFQRGFEETVASWKTWLDGREQAIREERALLEKQVTESVRGALGESIGRIEACLADDRTRWLDRGERIDALLEGFKDHDPSSLWNAVARIEAKLESLEQEMSQSINAGKRLKRVVEEGLSRFLENSQQIKDSIQRRVAGEAEQQIAASKSNLNRMVEQKEQYRRRYESKCREVAGLKKELQELSARHAAAHQTLTSIFHSRMWKLGLIVDKARKFVLRQASQTKASVPQPRPDVPNEKRDRVSKHAEPATLDPDPKAPDRAKQHSREKKWVIYTAVFGGYDLLKKPEVVPEGFDFVAFVDQPQSVPVEWQLRTFDYFDVDATRMARFVKTHPHLYFPEHEISIWLDANLLITGDLTGFVELMTGEHGVASFLHPHRNCLYEEAKEINRRGGLDDPGLVVEHVKRYEEMGYPAGAGLIETNVLVRRHMDPKVSRMNQDWWREIENGSKRDQLSFPFVLNANKIDVVPLAAKGTSVRNHPCLRRYLHGKDSQYSTPNRGTIRYATLSPAIQTTSLPREELEDVSVDLVVCVHDAIDHVKACLHSLVAARLEHHRMILVDDGSGMETQKYLAEFADQTPNTKLIRRSEAGGYTKAANLGLRRSSADYVVFVNSDTVVPKQWWVHMTGLGERFPDVGIIGPLSNAASWQSVPKALQDDGKLAVNSLPEGMDVDAVQAWLDERDLPEYARVPLVNGFFFAVKRAVIERIGEFDETNFPKGYGEENDYCFRAGDAGFGLVIATKCYVFHAKSKSYSDERRDRLAKAGSQAFRMKYPKHRIDRAIKSMRRNPILKRVRRAFGPLATSTERSGSVWLNTSKVGSGREVRDFNLTAEEVRANLALMTQFKKNPKPAYGHVLWFVPEFDHILRGGLRTIFCVAENLSQHWGTSHTFVVYGPKRPDTDRLVPQIEKNMPGLNYQLIGFGNGDSLDNLPDCDVAICTLWTSAYLLVRYQRCRVKFYFVQDFEPAFYAAGTTSGLIELTYRFGFLGLANSMGVAERYRAYEPWVGCFTPGIDREIFHPDVGRRNRPLRIVFYGRPNNPRNAFHLGLEALRSVKDALGSQVEILSVGFDFDPKQYGVENDIQNLGVLRTMDEIGALYRSCHIGLSFMFTAHPSYQPLEYMASGAAVVTNDNPWNAWLFRHRENALLADPIVDGVVDAILELATDRSLLESIQNKGLETVKEMSWDKAFVQIRNYLKHPEIAKASFLAGHETDERRISSPERI